MTTRLTPATATKTAEPDSSEYELRSVYRGTTLNVKCKNADTNAHIHELWNAVKAQAEAQGNGAHKLSINLSRSSITYYTATGEKKPLVCTPELKKLMKETQELSEEHLGASCYSADARIGNPAFDDKTRWENYRPWENTFCFWKSPILKSPIEYFSDKNFGKIAKQHLNARAAANFTPPIQERTSAFKHVLTSLVVIEGFKKSIQDQIERVKTSTTLGKKQIQSDTKALTDKLAQLEKEHLNLDAIYVSLTLWGDTQANATNEIKKQRAEEATNVMGQLLIERHRPQDDLNPFYIERYSQQTGDLLLPEDLVEIRIEENGTRDSSDPSIENFIVKTTIHLNDGNDDQIKQAVETLSKDLSEETKNALVASSITNIKTDGKNAISKVKCIGANWKDWLSENKSFIKEHDPSKSLPIVEQMQGMGTWVKKKLGY